jgi:outer membrane protein TolC
VDQRASQAGLLYEQAVFTGDTGPLAKADQQLDAAEADLNAAEADLNAAEADLAVTRGRILHTHPPAWQLISASTLILSG